jgi:hypothetical protein
MAGTMMQCDESSMFTSMGHQSMLCLEYGAHLECLLLELVHLRELAHALQHLWNELIPCNTILTHPRMLQDLQQQQWQRQQSSCSTASQ